MKNIIIWCAMILLLSSCVNKGNNVDIINEKTENKVENTIVEDNKTEGITEPNVNENTNIVDEEYIVDDSDFLNGSELIENIENNWDLTDEERDWLILMREEEKLAYDVYVTMYEKWGQKIFTNISKSEKTHIDAVWNLLEKYNIEDPIKENTVWLFTSENLQKLYNDLVAKWNISLLDALIVGITIEDLDIYDLDELSKKTSREDILTVYDNLNRGSRNHMRAFFKNISRQWWDYMPQFISIEKYNEIINGSQERGNKK